MVQGAKSSLLPRPPNLPAGEFGTLGGAYSQTVAGGLGSEYISVQFDMIRSSNVDDITCLLWCVGSHLYDRPLPAGGTGEQQWAADTMRSC